MVKSKRKANLLQKAFTLLEIIIVVGIAGSIVSIGTFFYAQINKNSRDATRKTDLQIISQTLEHYKSNHVHGSYPVEDQGIYKNDSGFKAYLSTVPVDPKTKKEYDYIPSSCKTLVNDEKVCLEYALSAKLETGSTYALGPYGETVSAPIQAPVPTATPTPPVQPTKKPKPKK